MIRLWCALSGMKEWWCADNGENYLKGANDDPENPPRLPDDVIIDFIRQISEARASFFRLLPNMLPEEQDRLRDLITGGNIVPELDPQQEEDIFQHALNVQGIRTAGPNGGSGYG